MSSTKDLNLGAHIEIQNGDQTQEHIKRSVGGDGEETKTNQVNGEKPDESSTSLSWWKRTTSLPSSLNRKKNILLQELRTKTKLNLVGMLIFFMLCHYNISLERAFVVQNITWTFLPKTITLN